MNYSIISMVFMFPALLGLLTRTREAISPLPLIGFLLVLSCLVIDLLFSNVRHKQGRTVPGMNIPLLLGYIAIHLFSALAVSSALSFPPFLIVYYTIALFLLGQLIHHVSVSLFQGLILVGSVCLGVFLLTLLLISPSFIALLFCLLPIFSGISGVKTQQ